MADPILVKISELPELTVVDAADQFAIVDASDTNDMTKTKRIRMDKLKLTEPDQLATAIVTTVKVADSAIIAGKLATDSVETVKIKNANVTTAKIADGAVTEGKLANDAVTEAKLGAIKRGVAIPVFGMEDAVIVKNFVRIMGWLPMLNNHIVVGASAVLLGDVSSSGAVAMTLTNQNGVMTTISIPQGAWSASSGAISATYYTAQSFATFSINVTSAGSGAKGLTVYLEVLG